MVALAHVEAPRIRDVAEVGEIDLVLGAHVAAAGRRLLQRNTVLMALGDVDEGSAVRPEQPFVGREDHEIRVETPHVHRQHAGALRGIDEEACSLPPQRDADLLDVDQPAVRPVHRRDRGEADRRRARPLDCRENRGCPVAVIRLAHRLDREACASARARHSSTGEE